MAHSCLVDENFFTSSAYDAVGGDGVQVHYIIGVAASKAGDWGGGGTPDPSNQANGACVQANCEVVLRGGKVDG